MATTSAAERYPAPDPFLIVRCHNLDSTPPSTGLCVGFESNYWRSEQLARHMLEWLPEFALTYSEMKTVQASNAYIRLLKSARSVYQTGKFGSRGEVGELLLHVALRQVFKSIPAITKLFYKDAANETVKGFDAVHVVEEGKKLELWLGEAKCYSEFSDAVRSVMDDLTEHTETDYLKGEFVAITNKLDDSWEHAEAVRKLVHRNTPIDQIVSALCIPVFIGYESSMLQNHQRVSAEYVMAFNEEIADVVKKVSDKHPKISIKTHFFFMPLLDKEKLLSQFDELLKGLQ